MKKVEYCYTLTILTTRAGGGGGKRLEVKEK